ncbi:MAG: hydrogenase expression/formation protein HypE [Gemmataceae bacterium]
MSHGSESLLPLSCPSPLPAVNRIVLAHGEGARLSRRLIRNELLAVLGNEHLNPLGDGALLPAIEGPLVMTTDSSVVSPLFFPGGDIGQLAVHSAINDLAVCGADPRYLSLAFILEEGLEMATLRSIVQSIGRALKDCNVPVVTGDTKVVPRGAVDQIFINVTGIGQQRPGIELGPHRVRPGDQILVSGTIGDHGLTILSARNRLEFEGLASDTAPIHGLVDSLLRSNADIRFLRDPTRGGVAGVLHELLEQMSGEICLDESALPLSEAGRGASELLGLDPWFIANEGKLVIVVAADDVDRALTSLRRHPLGKQAARIGEVRAGSTNHVVVKGILGIERILTEPAGAPLPRIC